MNYITACPACETQFLINTEHLKAYRGKVQCGNCQQIFNAKNRLTPVSDDVQNVEEYTADQDSNLLIESSEQNFSDSENNPESAEIAFEQSGQEQSNLEQSDLEQDDAIQSDTFEHDDVEIHADSPAESLISSATHSYIEPVHNADGKPLNEKLSVVLEGVPDLSDLTSVEATSDFSSPDFAPNDNLNNPYISNKTPIIVSENDIDLEAIRAPILIEDLTADPKFQLTKPKRNIWLILINIILLTLALLQSLYFLRGKIAADYPQFKPYIVQACDYLRCTVDLPQQLDLLTIDDSDMQESEDYKDVINFSSLIINKAEHVQAYPNIELTLTDTEDKPVLRKIVKPQEYLPANSNPVAGLAARQEQRIKLAINIHQLSVAGYRVLLTY